MWRLKWWASLSHLSYLCFDILTTITKANGKAPPSFVANSLSELGNDDEANIDVYAVKIVASGIFAGLHLLNNNGDIFFTKSYPILHLAGTDTVRNYFHIIINISLNLLLDHHFPYCIRTRHGSLPWGHEKGTSWAWPNCGFSTLTWVQWPSKPPLYQCVSQRGIQMVSCCPNRSVGFFSACNQGS